MINILFCDLDDTLITTVSGKTFPEGIWDMKPKFEVWDAIKVLKPDQIVIVSNQGGVELGYVSCSSIISKLQYICECIEDYTEIVTYYDICTSNDKNNPKRKPNPGMLEGYLPKDFNPTDYLMIGDASGKEGQWSDSDKQTAINAGIPYLDVDDFVKQYTISK